MSIRADRGAARPPRPRSPAPRHGRARGRRVEFLGRKAELPNLLRGVAELPPQERGAVGKAANEARKSLEAQIDAKPVSSPRRARHRLDAGPVDVTLPADPLPAIGRLHLITQTRRRSRTCSSASASTSPRAPRSRRVYYNFDALNHDPTHPARAWTTRSTSRTTCCCARHTSPMQVRSMELQPPPIYIIVPGRVYRRDSDVTHTPQFHQIEGLAVDEDITLGRPQGHAADVRARDLRPGARDPAAPALLPVHRAERRGRRLLLQLHQRRAADGERCPLCKGTAWIEILGSGMVDPNVLLHVKDNGYDPERCRASRSGWGSSGSRCSSTASPTCGCFYDNDIRFLEQFA
jgi:phenylalanyl-tRNA synthetase alpha chain